MRDKSSRHDSARAYRPLVNTGRKAIPLKKYPDNLDFTKSVGGTTYIIKSHFKPQGRETMFCIVSRRMDNNAEAE